jgi:uncharacterized membrane protein
VLISQNRLARLSETRADLDLQVNLLAEQKTTKVLELLDQIIAQLNEMDNEFHIRRDPSIRALTKSPTPRDVLQSIDSAISQATTEAVRQLGKATEEIAGDVEETRQDVQEVKERVSGVAEDVEEIREKMK